MRNSITNRGKIEIDDLYIGVDRNGTKYIIPLAAKSASERDKLGWVQVSNLVRFARQFFPKLICKPVAAKPIDRDRIYLIKFTDEINYEEITIPEIKLYKLIRKNTDS